MTLEQTTLLDHPAKSRSQRWLGWMLLGLVPALLVTDAILAPRGAAQPPALAFGFAVLVGAQFALLAFAGRLTERHRFSVPTEAAISFLVAAVVYGAGAFVAQAWLPPLEPEPTVFELFTEITIEALFVTGLWTVAIRYPNVRSRAEHASRLLREAELQELRARLQPHFLGNALNVASGLVVGHPERARELLATLGDLLRDLATDASVTRPLSAELAWCRRYATILDARHDGGLSWDFEISEAALSAEIPSFVLQPLLENAVVHSTGAPEPRHLRVAVEADPGRVRVIVRSPLGRRSPRLPGMGLELVRRRLAHFSEEASLTLRTAADEFVAELSIPRHARPA